MDNSQIITYFTVALSVLLLLELHTRCLSELSNPPDEAD